MDFTEKQEIVLKIDSLAFGGRGIGRTEGMVCFVEDALPGEEVRVRIIKIKKRYLEAKLLEIITSSPYRKTPPCPYFGECGGCQYQMIDYQEERRYKTVQVKECLQRIGGIRAEEITKDIVASPAEYYYRNNLDLKVVVDGEKTSFAFVHRNDRDRVFIEKCMIASRTINDRLEQIKNDLTKKNLEPGEYLLRIKEDGAHIFFCLKDSTGSSIISEEGTLMKQWDDNKVMNYSPAIFFQANWPVTSFIMKEIEKNLSRADATCLFDLYCGAGLFSIALSSAFKKVVGIERCKESFRFAVKNVTESGIGQALFYQGAAEKIFPKVWSRFSYERNVVLLDPPRGGCHPSLLDFLTGLKERMTGIFYVSCDPACLAKDLKVLSGGGFPIKKIIPFDMFPKTRHIETLAILGRE
jgi:tRNA/tmRNA/rRNA uracil-C5-methylase (TrmA/RlmC/RlmD family)